MHQKFILAIALCIASSAIAANLPGTLIVGGEEAAKNQFPYLVRFWVQSEGTLHFCSGTLIALDLVLTSASCVQNAEREIIVTAGDHSLSETDGTEQSLTSQQIILHENFNNNGHQDNDIALIKLSGKFQQTAAVRTIALPNAALNPDESEYGIALGWGATTVGGANADKVQRANIRIFESAQCAAFPLVELGDGDFCTLDTKGGSPGDNGGPLVCSGALAAVCGIMSSSIPDAGSENAILGLYIKVSSYLEWIAANTPVDPIDPTTTTTEGTTTVSDGTTTISDGTTTVSDGTTGGSTVSDGTTDGSTVSEGTTGGPTESTTAGSSSLAAGLLLTFTSVLLLLC